MSVYTVLQPDFETDPARTAERTVFLPDGFSWPAFLLGPIWLGYHRAWRALALWFIASVSVSVPSVLGWVHPDAIALVELAISIYLGIEGNSLREAALSRRKFRAVDVIAGDSPEHAEEVFFRRGKAVSASGVLQGGALRSSSVLGLFPEQEARR